MITFFTTPKPFSGHIGVIQRNAIESWKRVHPEAEVILFGDEEGAARASAELGIRHIPHVKRNQHGTKYLSSIFDGAQDLARHNFLCYINCDIILLSDFRSAANRVQTLGGNVLMAGRRWDTNVTVPIDFTVPEWEAGLRHSALQQNQQRPPQWIDYFAFSKGLYYKNTPPFVIGRPGWDNWLVWHARNSGARVVDASAVVQVVHQNHDYSYHADGEAGVWQGAEAQENYALLEGGRCFATMENATDRLLSNGLHPNYHHWVVQGKRKVLAARNAMWFGALGLTRPVRHRLGLRQRGTPAAPAQTK
jgi:hypothetical protein